jgi:conjugative transposon TraN protein
MTKTNLKKILFLLGFASSLAYSQTENAEIKVSDLPKITISEGINLHIISPEPIQFVDLSTNNIIGDLPAENIARIKIADSIKDKNNLGIITLVCQSFMVQYKLNYMNYNRDVVTNIQIQPEDMQPLDYPKMRFSNLELEKFALNILRKKKLGNPIRQEKNLQLKMLLNNIYVVNDYIFLDMTFENTTNLPYSIDGIKFSVEDKKIYKATNNQSIALEPVFRLYHQKEFKKNFRNIYVFRKFTFPNSKVLRIRLIEEQLSGRTVELDVKYSDILNADTF